MKHYKSLFIIMLVLLAGQNAFAQYFLKSYDFPTYGTSTDIGRSIEPITTTSGGWTVAGFTNSTPAPGGYNWMFVKLNSAGTVVCASVLGFPYDDSCFSHVKFSASPVNVLAGFYTTSTMSGFKEKASWSMVDTSCTHLMTKQISDTSRHQYRWVTKTTSNIFTLTGYIQAMTSSGYVDHILASQYTPAGVLVWAYHYLPPYPYVTERAYAICYQPSDGSYAITGVTNRFTGPGGALQVFIMKITSAGIPIWFKGYSPLAGTPSQSRRIVPTPDGGFVVTGWSSAYDPANDIWNFKVDAAGTSVWSFTYGMPGVREESYGIIYQPSDMSLVFTGLRVLPSATEDIVLGKITAVGGAPVWFRTYPNAAGSDRSYDLEEATSPMGYAVTGQLFASASTSLDPFLMRTDAIGNVTTGCLDSLPLQPRPGIWNDVCGRQILQLSDIMVQPQIAFKSLLTRDLCDGLTGIGNNNNETPNEYALEQNYPNPFNPTTKIGYSIPEAGNVTIKVFDITGKEVRILINEFRNTGNYTVEFNAADFPSGVYFYKIEANGFSDTKKMILMK